MFFYEAVNPYPEQSSGFFSWLPTPSFLSKKLGKIILRSQNSPPVDPELFNAKLESTSDEHNVKIERGEILTHDGASLDTIEITPSQLVDTPICNKRFIIKFKGNFSLYESSLEAFVENAVTYNAVVIGFNYRGVGCSLKAPSTFQELVIDGIAQVQRLLTSGAVAQNILLDGESLGGAVATLVAEYLHSQEEKVYVWNSRSFSSLATLAAEKLAPKFPNFVKRALGGVISYIGWGAESGAAYERIGAQYKAYMIVAKKKPDVSIGDGVIPHECSLHRWVRTKEKERDATTGYKVNAPARIFYVDENDGQKKERYGHTIERELLVSKDSAATSGEELFSEFVQKLGMP